MGILAGTQSGKTSYLPLWHLNEMTRCGAGDYLAVSPTFQLLEKKMLPEYIRVFEKWLKVGKYIASPVRQFVFSEDGARRVFGDSYNALQDDLPRILFGYAADPESLESATCKAAVLDEAGQKKFKLGALEAIQRRLSLAAGVGADGIPTGRMLLATSLYALNWLKDKHDLWRARLAPEWEFINFASVANPMFPSEEFERARRELPRWKFRMQYLGLFERPAGLLYDVVERMRHYIPRTALPAKSPRIAGLDFGPVNTAAVVLVASPFKRGAWIVEREYKPGRLTPREHVENLKRLGVTRAFGGAPSEDEIRDDFKRAGLPVSRPPVADMMVQIERTYAAFKTDRLQVFEDCSHLRDELGSLGFELDEQGEPTDELEDEHDYHLCAALRYGVSSVIGDVTARGVAAPREVVIPKGRY